MLRNIIWFKCAYNKLALFFQALDNFHYLPNLPPVSLPQLLDGISSSQLRKRYFQLIDNAL